MDFTDFDRRRIELYVAGLHGADHGQSARDVPRDTVICGSCETRSSIERRNVDRFPKGLGAVYSAYVRQAQALFSFVAPTSSFSVCAADNRSRFLNPTIVKSRLVADRNSQGVLLPLDRNRHWGELLHLSKFDRPFDQKDDRLVWRGATTGVFNRAGLSVDYSARYYVALQNHKNANIDIKYNKIVQLDECVPDIPIELIKAHHDPQGLSLAQQMASKFLLCLEGNDVATALKWMMASNSTVIMPTPTCETWFCEGELVPWEHYVPIDNDLSNIEDVYDWCLTNNIRCREIAQNGKRFISKFLSVWNEANIIREVINCYVNSSDIDVHFPLRDRVFQAGNCVGLQFRFARFLASTVLMRRGIGAF
ncbi:glycosyl transferase family 90 [Ancylobacter pratisalsi]|uniref:Glycosyl transferase CAP10 domain-containing protein n=1 Tax=Ancylobacter pratisalsi TaxID=1745854 RepID=A0A6P1YQ19_9HYPH|nr:glycosyl transferase family 90 [Ancylobacter pratisalsi]QIB35000.1 hypothetical protein G3A50_15750 [Ancylobacter pratisalsi]